MAFQTETTDSAGRDPLPPESVAVIIPTYNRSHYLRQAIGSVLAQTRPVDELIVVDDGSTDDTAAVCAGYPGIRYMYQQNQRQQAARNRAMRDTTATFVYFLDDDDLLMPETIERQLAVFRRRPEVDLVYGRQLRIDADGQVIGENFRGHGRPRDMVASLLHNCFVRIQTVLVRREVVLEAGGFDQEMHPCDDYDLWIRLALAGKEFAFLPDLLAKYRVLSGSQARQHDLMVGAHLRVLQKNMPHVPERYAAVMHYVLGRALMAGGEDRQAAGEFRAALRRAPWRLRYAFFAAITASPSLKERGLRVIHRGQCILDRIGLRSPD